MAKEDLMNRTDITTLGSILQRLSSIEATLNMLPTLMKEIPKIQVHSEKIHNLEASLCRIENKLDKFIEGANARLEQQRENNEKFIADQKETNAIFRIKQGFILTGAGALGGLISSAILKLI